MNKANEVQTTEPSKWDDFNNFWEKVFHKPYAEPGGMAIVCLLIVMIAFALKYFLTNSSQTFGQIWKIFWENDADLVAIIVTFGTLLTSSYVSFLKHRARKRDSLDFNAQLAAAEREKLLAVQREREAAIATTQKEHIRILDDFSPQMNVVEFYDDRSIYSAITSMLCRLGKELTNKELGHYKVSMLLCSPALDYWGNERSRLPLADKPEWGVEFRDIVRKLAVCNNLEFDICHLPLESVAGVNAMGDFISALTAHIIQSESQFKTYNPVELDAEFRKIYDTLMERSRLVWEEFDRLSRQFDTKHRFHIKPHTINIPFQILLVTSNDASFMEVVVSFAGREVLERKQQRGVKGFFSSDPYVVKTFREVFQTYVDSPGRIPYIPKHTSNISDLHDEKGAHVIPGYYYNLVGPLKVLPQSFSPVIGNSTKFTVWLLDKLLTTGKPGGPYFWGAKMKKILDVGSGTGVLALTTSAILRDHCNHKDYSIIAIESCPHAQQVLSMNTSNDSKIEVKPWSLCFIENENGELTDACFKDKDNKKVYIEDEFANFDLITADLPFVHAHKRKDSDLRFLDCDHLLHQALFHVSAHTKLLASGGLLITAFSSLGGPEDISDFERHVSENKLQVIQRVDFHESGYMWMVYALMKKEGYDSLKEKLWWEALDAQNSEAWTPPS